MTEWHVTIWRSEQGRLLEAGDGRSTSPGEAYRFALRDLGLEVCDNCGTIVEEGRVHSPETLGRCYVGPIQGAAPAINEPDGGKRGD
jgi:hypothetical protein